jgi:tRNA A37 threonylcarbamoyladenosine modification protein TsaB
MSLVLMIDTTQNNLVKVGVKDGTGLFAENNFYSNHQQAEQLLPGIIGLLKTFKLTDLRGIEVVNRGGGFTSLRIGVVTANALGYALGVPVTGIKKSEVRNQKSEAKNLKFSVVKPWYNREPV